jgi:hypothetical protein
MAVESGLPEGSAQGQLRKAEGEGGEGPSPRRPRHEAGPDPEEGQGAWRGSRRTLMALLFFCATNEHVKRDALIGCVVCSSVLRLRTTDTISHKVIGPLHPGDPSPPPYRGLC